MIIDTFACDLDETITHTPNDGPVFSTVKLIEQTEKRFNGIYDEAKLRFSGCKSYDTKAESAYEVLGEFQVPFPLYVAASDMATDETRLRRPFDKIFKKYQPKYFFLITGSDWVNADHIRRKTLEPLLPETKFLTLATRFGIDEKNIITKHIEELYGPKERAEIPVNLHRKREIYGNVLGIGDKNNNGVNNGLVKNSDIGISLDEYMKPGSYEIVENTIYCNSEDLVNVFDFICNELEEPSRIGSRNKSQLHIDLEKISEREKTRLDMPELIITSV